MKDKSVLSFIVSIITGMLLFKIFSTANLNQRRTILWISLAIVVIVFVILIIILWTDKVNRIDMSGCIMRTCLLISLMICFASVSLSLIKKQENQLINETNAKIYFNDREISKKEIEKINYKHFKYDEKNNVIYLSN